MSKLEQIAAMCLQGLLSNPNCSPDNFKSIQKYAILHAQYLIEFLPKETRRRVAVLEDVREGGVWNGKLLFRYAGRVEGWFSHFATETNHAAMKREVVWFERDDGRMDYIYAENIVFI
jgi:hypothetical protein